MLPIVRLPATTLREPSVDIDKAILASKDVQTFIDEMIPAMYGDDGIGIAAPQLGKNVRIFIVGKEALKDFEVQTGTVNKTDDLVVINARWKKLSRKITWDTEGCLSVPKTFGKVKRCKDVELTAQDRHGNLLILTAHNYMARVLQHETDHLDGILFVDKAKDIHTVD